MNPVLLYNLGRANAASTDADADAYLLATGIPNDGTVYYTGTAQQITGAEMHTAIQDLVIDLKFYGIWTKIKYFYPFLGGTAFTHKWNLKDPQDTDAAYRLSFVNSPTHSAFGFQGNGSNSYGNTFFNPSTGFANKSVAIGMYVSTINTVGTSDRHNMGCYSGASNFFSLNGHGPVSYDLQYAFLSGADQIVSASAAAPGYCLGNSTTTDKAVTHNGTTSSSTAITGNFANLNVWIGCLNLNNAYYKGTDAKMNCAWMMTGLSSTEVSNLRSALIDYNTALHR